MATIDLVGKTCSGCGACVNVCGKKSIRMEFDHEGFLFPRVDKDSCVDCGRCYDICPAMQVPQLQSEHACMGALSKQTNEIQGSASGGVFYTLGKYFVERGGIVCGAVMGIDKLVTHQCTDTVDGLRAMQDSKYVQSSTVQCYSQIKQYLKAGKEVLFTGTPCQVAGLYACTGHHDRLWTVDIVCHGVPSPLFFKKHIQGLEETKKKTAQQIRFRMKDERNKTAYILKLYEDETCWHSAYCKNDLYYALFMDGATFRESCYSCPYASSERCGDITIGDLGSYRAYPDFYPHEATSVVLLNSKRGQELWKACDQAFHTVEVSFEKEQKNNHQLSAPCKRPKLRDIIYQELQEKPEEEVYRNHCPGLTAKERISLAVKRYLPVFVVRWIRSRG